jgi:hypothetical protein
MKFVSELICFVFILLAMSASSSVKAIPRTNMDDLYSDNLYMPGFDAEIPGALESSARLTDEGEAVEYNSATSDIVNLDPVEAESPVRGKKLSSRPSRKKSSRN